MYIELTYYLGLWYALGPLCPNTSILLFFVLKNITSGLMGTNEDNYGSLIEIYFDLRNLNIFY